MQTFNFCPLWRIALSDVCRQDRNIDVKVFSQLVDHLPTEPLLTIQNFGDR
jgi:hypothetical protein